MLRYFILVLLLFPLVGNAKEWRSGTKQVQVVELFTSEGCSSCPAADRWLSGFKDQPNLFESVIPIAFHVDYWDFIGWKDPFASSKYSQRQRNYVRKGHVGHVYTPGFVVNNKEWQSWFRGETTPPQVQKETGQLIAQLADDSRTLKVTYSGNELAVLNVAYLGIGITSNVRAGENRNKKLEHDFVAVNHFTQTGRKEWTTKLPKMPQLGQQRTALAVWVATKNTDEILQATGGYLN